MFINYLKTAFRNLLKYKGFSFINVIGLAFGVACCLLILLFVQDELSYDTFHEKYDRIYRSGFDAFLNNNASKGVVSCGPLAEALVTEFPEVEASTRARNYGFPVFRYGEKVFSEEKVFWVDSTFFDVFTVSFIHGDPKTALTKPASIVLTKSMAIKYFGDDNPIGKSLNADNRRDYLVLGVVEDVPRNSHFHYDFLASLITYPVARDVSWVSNNYYTYFVMKEGASAAELETKINVKLSEHAGAEIQQALGITMEQFIEGGGIYRYFLQKLSDIHLHSHLDYEIEANGNYAYVLIFSIVAFGILLVACINFINLATARSSNRSKEVGIRKTVGSTRGQLIRQFLVETTFLSLIAVILAIIFVNLFIGTFNTMSGKLLDFSLLTNPVNIIAILGLILIIGLMAGTYPAFFLASFQPVSVLRREKSKNSRRSWTRSVLVVFQFAVSIMLIIGTLIVRNQMEYTRTTDLGFNKEDVIIVQKTDDLADNLRPFKLALLENANIKSVSNTNRLMGQPFGNSVFIIPGETGEETHLLWTFVSDPDFAKTYEIEVVDGRYFEEGRETDIQACVINESAVATLGFKEPIGKEIQTPSESRQALKILGVVKDFHFESMHQIIRPMIIFPFQQNNRGRYLSVRIQPNTLTSALTDIERTWRKFANNQAFEYEVFEDHFARIYLPEEKTAGILFSFSILAIIIASLGLFGLAAFIAEQRTKEIGVRKVLGATISGVVLLLTKQFTKWVIIANIIAWPAAWFIMNEWLKNFAYQAPFTLTVFFYSAVVALVIAILTVSYQSIKAAITNPVDSLRYE